MVAQQWHCAGGRAPGGNVLESLFCINYVNVSAVVSHGENAQDNLQGPSK
jgi:hypothetical protein